MGTSTSSTLPAAARASACGAGIAAALGLTVADVVMPDGGRLEKTGVRPDFGVVPTAADVDAADAWKLVHDVKDELEHLDD